MSFLSSLHAPIYARRLEVLTQLICAQLKQGERVLDVGCGSGQLGAALLASSCCPNDVQLQGCEKVVRGGEPIEVLPFDGYQLDAPSHHWDVSILADVVHHEKQPQRLLSEVARVTKRAIIIKDHKADGFFAYPRICLMDWAANKPYGVPCLYRYFSPLQWREQLAPLGFKVEKEQHSIQLYPRFWNALFGNSLQYFAVAKRMD